MTNIELFEYFFLYHKENPAATLCPILGPFNFIMWLIQKHESFGTNPSDIERVVILHNIMLQAINETP